MCQQTKQRDAGRAASHTTTTQYSVHQPPQYRAGLTSAHTLCTFYTSTSEMCLDFVRMKNKNV